MISPFLCMNFGFFRFPGFQSLSNFVFLYPTFSMSPHPSTAQGFVLGEQQQARESTLRDAGLAVGGAHCALR